MKINDIYESTTSGSVATVSQPMNGKAISRNNVVGKGVYTNAKVGNLLTGKKTKKTFANSLSEAPEFKNRQQVIDYFIKQGKTASQGAMAWERGYRGGKKKTNNPAANWASDRERRQNNREDDVATLGENDLHEDDFILVPGQGNKLISGFIPHDQDRTDHEVQMARGDLFQCAKNAKQILDLIRDRTEDEGIEGWVQAKITKASDYLTTIRQYLEGLRVHEGFGDRSTPAAELARQKADRDSRNDAENEKKERAAKFLKNYQTGNVRANYYREGEQGVGVAGVIAAGGVGESKKNTKPKLSDKAMSKKKKD